MTYHIDIQEATPEPIPFSPSQFTQWATLAVKDHMPSAELTLRLVASHEIQTLNRLYRQVDKPTNVLAFPSDHPEAIPLDCTLLGDVIICPEILAIESQALNKPLIEHTAHIVMHGVLHLLGFNHIETEERQVMQAIEIQLLASLGYSNPYNTEDHHGG
jgi:probable rRNA maturation factor